jgi:hypothetical protein
MDNGQCTGHHNNYTLPSQNQFKVKMNIKEKDSTETITTQWASQYGIYLQSVQVGQCLL